MDHGQEFCLCVCSGTTGLTKGELLGVRLRGGGGYSGFQVTRRCEWGHKLKAKKNSLDLKQTPRNPLDQNDVWTGERVSSGTAHGGKR